MLANPNWWFNLINNPAYYSQFAGADYWSSLGDGGGGPAFSVTGTGYADKQAPIDWSWMMKPPGPEDYGQSPPQGGGGGGGGSYPTPPPAQPPMPIPEEPADPVEPFNPPPSEAPITGETWNPQNFPDSGAVFPIDVLGAILAGGAGAGTLWNQNQVPPTELPPETSETWNPPEEVTGGTPTSPITVNAPPFEQPGELWNNWSPYPEQPPPTSATWNPISPQTPPFEQGGGPWIQPWFPPPTTPPVAPPIAGGGGETPPTTPGTPPSLPNLSGAGGSGAPGPGLFAPVVGDPIADQLVFNSPGLPPQQGQMPNFSAILAQILGGSYAPQ